MLGEGISVVFRSGTDDPAVTYVNHKLVELLDMEEEEPRNGINALSEVLKPMGISLELLKKVARESQTLTIHTGIKGLRHLLLEYENALEISDAQGIAGLSALIFTDTTRYERGKEASQAAEAQARNLANLKTAFLANMSHEIRTPMNGIMGMIEVLQSTAPTQEQQRYLNIMERSSNSLMR